MSAPLLFRWSGEAMEPLNSTWAKRADQQYVVGQIYRMDEAHERSLQSHRHFFACLHEAFLNLPPQWAERFANEDALRAYCLIHAGFCDERSIVCASKAEAERVAAFIKPMDPYAIVAVRAATIKVYTAQSQSMKAQGKKDFAASKTAVLEILAGMLNITVETLAANAAVTPERLTANAGTSA